MDELQSTREILDRIDREMAELFLERMKTVRVIAEKKQEQDLPIHDPVREKIVLEKNAAYVDDRTVKPYYYDFMKTIMTLSKRYQYMQIFKTDPPADLF